MPEKVELAIVALSNSESQPGNFALILEDLVQQRRIPVIIGASEAQAIAIALEKMQPLRPLTHDLFKNALDALQSTLTEVFIYQLKDGVFYARMLLRTASGDSLELDARTSDAIALAVRCDAPIFTYDYLIEEAGVWAASLLGRQRKSSLAEYSIPELEELLRKVVEKEDYESAARLRNYLDERRKLQ